MTEENVTGGEFNDLVEIFRILRKWRDERNMRLMEREILEEQESEGSNDEIEYQTAEGIH
jgi:RNA polymerase-interacting CarD/CdnL/TRCF family regulator